MSKRTAVLRREEIHRFGTGGKKRIDARGIETVAGLMAQIGPRLIGAFDDAPVARQRGAGNPEPAAGARGGAAKARLLLDDQDVEPVMPRGDRRRHAGAAGADHQHIAFVSFLFVARHAIRPAVLILGRTFGLGSIDLSIARFFPSPHAGEGFPAVRHLSREARCIHLLPQGEKEDDSIPRLERATGAAAGLLPDLGRIERAVQLREAFGHRSGGAIGRERRPWLRSQRFRWPGVR